MPDARQSLEARIFDLEIIVTDHQTLLRRLVRDVSAAGAMLAESRRHDEDG
ncbi:MAG TPA: hypothetical protein VGK05_02240 [Acidimicrobiia bacterium]|jgi:hypothetical protein